MTTLAPPAPPQRAAAKSPRHHYGTDALLLLMALIWGINFSVVKYGTRLVPPLAFNGVRVTIAAIALLAIAFTAREAWPDRRTTLTLLGLGVIGNGLYQIAFIEGVARTRAGAASLVLAASPAFIALIGWMRGVERTGPGRTAGIALSLGGAALVIFGTTGAARGTQATLPGNLLVLAACLCWSLFTVLLKPHTERVSGAQLAALTMVGGAVPLLVVSAGAIAATSWRSLPLAGWGAVLYSGILGLVVAYFCWYHGVRVLGPTRTAMYSNLQPVIALLFAWATLGEVPTFLQVAGAAAILGGLLLTRA